MRTKHLLTAMVLPALFAACTNDDFQTAAPEAPVNAEGRNLVENVTLNLGAPETRLAYDGDYIWEAEDEIGACLMDEITSRYGSSTAKWRERFNLTDYIQTNYKFTYDGESEWTTEAKLLEGNYFFCYPYDVNNGVRDAYTFSAKAQTMTGTSTADLQKAYAENNSFIGFGKVEKGASEGEALDVALLNVFGATGITIGTTGTQTYTIERVVLRGTKVRTEATVNPLTCTPATQYHPTASYTATNLSGTTYPNGTGMYNQVFNVAQYTRDTDDMCTTTNRPGTGDYVSNWSTYNNNPYAALRDVLDYEPGVVDSGAEVILEGGNVINANTTINVIVMVAPDETITLNNTLGGTADNQVVLDIYTDKGIIRDIQLNHRYSANDANTGATTNILTDVALTEIGTGNKVEVTFDDTSVDVPASMTIYSGEDLANLIHWNAGIAANLTATLETNVTLTKEMYAELAKSPASLTIAAGTANHTLTIAKDVADGALDNITFNNNSVVVAGGTQSISGGIGTATLTINNGATVNITKTVSLAQTITNNGTLNVNGGNLNGAGVITNRKTMTVAANRTVGKPVTNGESSSAKGTITNNGTITVLTNSAYGTVTNNGAIGSTTAQNSTNAGIISNNGNARAYLATNAGVIYANDLSATSVVDNKTGSIVITDLDNDGNFIVTTTSAEGAIVQEIEAAANTDAIDTRANTVWLSAALNVNKKDKDGNAVAVDLSDINVIATGAARINGIHGGLKLASIAVDASCSLLLSNEDVTVKANTIVLGNKAKLTINSNASLKAETGTLTAQKGSNAVVENFSSETDI